MTRATHQCASCGSADAPTELGDRLFVWYACALQVGQRALYDGPPQAAEKSLDVLADAMAIALGEECDQNPFRLAEQRRVGIGADYPKNGQCFFPRPPDRDGGWALAVTPQGWTGALERFALAHLLAHDVLGDDNVNRARDGEATQERKADRFAEHFLGYSNPSPGLRHLCIIADAPLVAWLAASERGKRSGRLD
jgi:hypothetical protein